MLCRIILTTIAISCTFSREITVHARGQGSQRLVQIKDVICVLLLSGLQKEDLDVNTLAKLQRHNVNIYDMNNESLRHECLSKSYLGPGKDAKTYEVTEDINDTSEPSTNRQNELSTIQSFSHNMNLDRQNSNIVTPEGYFVDNTHLRNLLDERKVKAVAQTKQDSYNKVNMELTESRPDNINISAVKENRVQQIEYIKDKPSLDSVMRFWAQLANKDSTKASTETQTTRSPPPRENKIETITSTIASHANEQSKDIEYISKVIAEYLKSHTIPTTTEASKTRTKTMDIVSRTIKEFLDKNSKTDYITVTKNVESNLGKDLKELSDLTEIGKLFEDNNKQEEQAENARRMQQKINEEKKSDKVNSSEVSIFKVSPSTLKSVKKIQALQYLNDMLKVNNKFKLNDQATSSMEVHTQPSTIKIKHDERLEKEKILHEYNTKTTNYNNYVSSMGRSTDLVKDNSGTVSADIIKEIAEKVKEIVMKDIRKEIPTTQRVTTYLTTTTSASATASQTSSLKETNQTSVIQTLMELLKELNTMKDTTTTTTTHMSVREIVNSDTSDTTNFRKISLDPMYPPVLSGFNPYLLKAPVSKIKQFEVKPYNQNLVPIPFDNLQHSPPQRPIYIPHLNTYSKGGYKTPPITIQTNSAEIPPLLIEMSKPIKLMNQHIIVTTQNPFQKQREEKLHRENKQKLNYNYEEPFQVVSEGNHHIENPTYADLTKKLRIAQNVKKEFRESYKDKIEKLKERIEHNRAKTTKLRRPIESDRGIALSGVDKSNHHVSPILDLNHHGGQIDISNHHDSLNSKLEFNRQLNFNQPVNSHPHENLNLPADSSYRDIITREVLNRLVDSNRHDVISQLMDSNPNIRRPIDSNDQSRSHPSDAYEKLGYERSHPRYKATKFHEKLEQIENMPQGNHESYGMPPTQSYCDTVASRQQMPLSKVKEHLRFDDSHFRNFLNSQQKVTDMLERILAAKSKARKESAETK